MARVIGVGGVFFKSSDPARLRAFYARCLGLPEYGDGVAFTPSMLPPGGCTVWSTFTRCRSTSRLRGSLS